jgi:hypothetical protein
MRGSQLITVPAGSGSVKLLFWHATDCVSCAVYNILRSFLLFSVFLFLRVSAAGDELLQGECGALHCRNRHSLCSRPGIVHSVGCLVRGTIRPRDKTFRGRSVILSPEL